MHKTGLSTLKEKQKKDYDKNEEMKRTFMGVFEDEYM